MIIILTGAPGSGKGTQSALLAKYYNIETFSTGDALRQHVACGTEIGLQIDALMERGELASDEIVLAVLKIELDRKPKALILDGYPRNVAQAGTLSTFTDYPVRAVLHLDVPKDVLVERTTKRGRKDDKPEAVAERLDRYENSTKPIFDYYTEKGLYFKVDGLGTTEEVFSRLTTILNKIFTASAVQRGLEDMKAGRLTAFDPQEDT